MRSLIPLLLATLSACVATDFGECVNGAVRRGDKCVFLEDSSTATDGGKDAGSSAGGAEVIDAGPDASIDGDRPDAEPDATMPECEDHVDCHSGAPTCIDGECQACRNNDDCSRFSDVRYCSENGACVACTANDHCLDPAAPICGIDFTCKGGCTADSQCKRSAPGWSTPYCELGSGTCAQCIPGALELDQCTNGRACDPEQFTCSGAQRGTVSNCKPCITDTECAAGLKCVPTIAAEAPSANYCVLQKDSGLCPDRFSSKRTATSILNITAAYCFPDEALTTCEAVLGFRSPCSLNEPCPVGGFCQGAEGEARCTYECDDRTDCSTECTGVEPSYCNPS